MKILFNAYSLPNEQFRNWGGPQAFTSELTSFFHHKKIDFVGLVLRSDKSIKDGVSEVQRISNRSRSQVWTEFKTSFHIKDILHSKSMNVDKFTSNALKVLSDYLKQEQPDVVLLSGFSMLNWYILKAASLASVPVVVSHHGLWFKEVSEIISNPSSMTVKITKKMEKDITKYAAQEIFLNEFSLREYEKNIAKVSSFKRNIVPISYNPVYTTAGKALNSKVVKIGFVGRWNPIKQPQLVSQIAREASRQGKSWKFYAVTKLNDSKSLRKYKVDFQKRVTVIEHLRPQDLKKFYQDMNVLLLPSRFDVSPTVVLEAALQNRGTLISPNVGWVSLYKKFDMKEWIFDYGNPKLAVTKIESLLARRLSGKYVSYLKKHFSSKQVLAEYVKVLKKAIR